ncbi:MAG: hypothetical protein RLZZ175_3207 [Bacteroidota bacterium]|jgi:uncharacterized protein YndB with AHSA1/START domain
MSETNQDNQMITVETTVNASLNTVWDSFTNPTHITQWCFASDDWHAPYAENDIQTGGKFKTTMAAKDGSFSFDFEGEYSLVKSQEEINYFLEDGRTVKINFISEENSTKVIETFDPENENPADMQKAGWQAILDNFKKYTESI